MPTVPALLRWIRNRCLYQHLVWPVQDKAAQNMPVRVSDLGLRLPVASAAKTARCCCISRGLRWSLGLGKQLRFYSFSAVIFAFELHLNFHFLSPARWLIACRSLSAADLV